MVSYFFRQRADPQLGVPDLPEGQPVRWGDLSGCGAIFGSEDVRDGGGIDATKPDVYAGAHEAADHLVAKGGGLHPELDDVIVGCSPLGR